MKRLLMVVVLVFALTGLAFAGSGGSDSHDTYNTYTGDIVNQGGTGGQGGAGGQGGTGIGVGTAISGSSSRATSTAISGSSSGAVATGGKATATGGKAVGVGSVVVEGPKTTVEGAKMSVGGTYIDPGTGRQAPGLTDPINPQFLRPTERTSYPQGYIASEYLPTHMSRGAAEMLAGDAKTIKLFGDKKRYENPDCKLVKFAGSTVNYVVGIDEESMLRAWAAAWRDAMDQGGAKVALVNFGFSDDPSAFFIGIGGAYTGSGLSGDKLQNGRTGGGSGLIGYAKTWANPVFYCTFAIYR